MFLIEDKEGREFDRWSTLELAVQSAKEFLERDPSLSKLLIIEGDQQTGERYQVKIVKRSRS